MSAPAPLRLILRRIGGHHRWVAATAAIASAAAASGIGLIACASVLISRSALLDSTASLALLIVAVRFFATTRVVLRYVERLIGHLGTFRLLTRIRTWFFDSVIPIAPRGLIDRTTGQLLSTVLDDVDTMQDLYLRVLVPPIVALVLTIVATLVIAVVDPLASLILLAILATAIGLILLLTRRRSRLAIAAMSECRQHSTSLLLESLDAARELAMFGAHNAVLERSAEIDRSTETHRARLVAARTTAEMIISIAGPAAAMVLTAVGIGAVRSGSLPGEQLAMLPLVGLAAAEMLGMISGSLEAGDRSRSAAARLLGLADRGAERDRRRSTGDSTDLLGHRPIDPSSSSGASLEVRGLGLRSGSDEIILDDLSFTVPAGGVLAISGSSGAGKSTVIDLLLGFEDHQGTICVDGVDLRSIPAARARLPFTAVRQQDHVFDTTIRDNLAVADADASDERMMEMLRIAGLDGVVEALPERLATRTGPDGARLSGGERQRLLIARALLADRPILLLDEAFEHLDSERRALVLRSVLDHQRGRTTVMVTHDPLAIGAATQHLRLHEGHMQSETGSLCDQQR